MEHLLAWAHQHVAPWLDFGFLLAIAAAYLHTAVTVASLKTMVRDLQDRLCRKSDSLDDVRNDVSLLQAGAASHDQQSSDIDRRVSEVSEALRDHVRRHVPPVGIVPACDLTYRKKG